MSTGFRVDAALQQLFRKYLTEELGWKYINITVHHATQKNDGLQIEAEIRGSQSIFFIRHMIKEKTEK